MKKAAGGRFFLDIVEARCDQRVSIRTGVIHI